MGDSILKGPDTRNIIHVLLIPIWWKRGIQHNCCLINYVFDREIKNKSMQLDGEL